MIEPALALRLLLALSVVGLVLFGMRALGGAMLRIGIVRPARRWLRVDETLALPQGSTLHVVRIADRRFALARNAGYIGLLCELPDDALEARAHPHRR
ncbi:MAG TPA: flagellar biosynthetic protein FliO [Candidatus Baltobacteraceae bacterium]|nr:flagellar biosynthetic protein FliO [Candidatus Baltobacteraceae bacterium]